MKFGSRKSPLVSGIFMMIVAVGAELVGIFAMLPEGTGGIIALICFTIFFSGWLFFLGTLGLREYSQNAKCIEKALGKYGKENVITMVENETRIQFQSPWSKQYTYFTDDLIIQSDTAIFSYNEIGMIYRCMNTTGSIKKKYIAFALLDGKTYYLCDCPSDEEITKIINYCVQKNPRILAGNSKENKKQYKINVKGAKS